PGEEDLTGQRRELDAAAGRILDRSTAVAPALDGRLHLTRPLAGEAEQQVERVPAVIDEDAAAGNARIAAPLAADAHGTAGADGFKPDVLRTAHRAVRK